MIGIVIPALDPPSSLLTLVEELQQLGMGPLVVVNDGSSVLSVFSELEALDGVTVLHHERNRGKGDALKTGFRHLLIDATVTSIMTVDADGQHLASDVRMLQNVAMHEAEALILGTRDFDGEVPFRSALGNRMTRSVLALTTGLRLRDTQTGLRVLPRRLVQQSLSLASGGYAFEFEMLFLAKRLELRIKQVAISTVYIEGNRESHFRPFRDSLQIYAVFVRFLFVSLASFCIDVTLFALIHWFSDSIFFSTYAARITSGALNFLGNRHFAFLVRGRNTVVRDLLAYVTLAFLVSTASGTAVTMFSQWLGWMPTIVKIWVDPCLFIVSFAVQRFMIFGRRVGTHTHEER